MKQVFDDIREAVKDKSRVMMPVIPTEEVLAIINEAEQKWEAERRCGVLETDHTGSPRAIRIPGVKLVQVEGLPNSKCSENRFGSSGRLD